MDAHGLDVLSVLRSLSTSAAQDCDTLLRALDTTGLVHKRPVTWGRNWTRSHRSTTAMEEVMQYARTIVGAGILALASFGPNQARAQNNFIFAMVPTGGVEACIAKAAGRVTITPTLALIENMHVEISHLPPKTDFTLFVIQVPTSPFGLSWYMGDMLTDAAGTAVGDFIGRFSIGTFIV